MSLREWKEIQEVLLGEGLIMDNAIDSLCDAISRLENKNLKILFWVCPNGCRDQVVWTLVDGKNVATCQKCGASKEFKTVPKEPK